jgi:hypothetical protein
LVDKGLIRQGEALLAEAVSGKEIRMMDITTKDGDEKL